MLAFFVGLSMTPLARATALSFTAPLFTALLSALFLGEVFRWRRWTAIFAGFFGALVILRPGLQAFDFGSLLVLFSSLLWSMALIDIKVLGRTESTLTITVYVTVLLIPMTAVPAALVWETPGLDLWVWLIFIGVIGTLGQLVVTEAVKLADMTVLMPFDFLKLVWAAFLGIILFAELPDALTWLGGAIVFGSSFYIAWLGKAAQGESSGSLNLSLGGPSGLRQAARFQRRRSGFTLQAMRHGWPLLGRMACRPRGMLNERRAAIRRPA
jgi:drug/metabolite transporter (DMT)-like permease